MRTLQYWIEECSRMTSLIYRKYSSAWNDNNCSDRTRQYYGDVAKSYHNLRMLLLHIKKTGTLIDNISCDACRSNDLEHMNLMKSLYCKYEKLIKKAINAG